MTLEARFRFGVVIDVKTGTIGVACLGLSGLSGCWSLTPKPNTTSVIVGICVVSGGGVQDRRSLVTGGGCGEGSGSGSA